MQCDKRYVTMQYDKCNVLDRPASQTNVEDQLSGPARQTRQTDKVDGPASIGQFAFMKIDSLYNVAATNPT